jgi:hypothetical protein
MYSITSKVKLNVEPMYAIQSAIEVDFGHKKTPDKSVWGFFRGSTPYVIGVLPILI